MDRIISQHIEIIPGICGGKPRIAGHRIKVQDIVIRHETIQETNAINLNLLTLDQLSIKIW